MPENYAKKICLKIMNDETGKYIKALILAVSMAATVSAGAAETAVAAEAAETPASTEAEEGAQTVGLKELIEEGLDASPRLKAAKLEWARVIEKYPQATAWSDPMLTYMYPIDPIETRLGPTEQGFMLSQKIPFPGKLDLKGRIVIKEVKMARVAYEGSVRDLVVDIKKTYYELYYLDTAIRLAGQNLAVLGHLSELGTTDYAGDSAALSDVIKAQSMYAQAGYDLLLLKELRYVEVTRVNTLLDRHPESPLPPVEEPQMERVGHTLSDITLDDLYEMASGNEEVRSARLKVEKSELAVDLSEYKNYPDFKVGLNYTDIGEAAMPGVDGSGRDAVAVTFNINLPLWFSKNKAARAEAVLGRKKATMELRARENDVENMVKKHFFKVRNSERLVELYSNHLVPQARRTMETAETWYETGEGSLAQLLETQSIFYNFQLAYHRAAADYLRHLADLESVTGRVQGGGGSD